MGWKLIGKPKTVKVTRQFAQEFAGMDPAPHDRPLSERRLQVYRKLFNDGSFRPCTWAKAYCKEVEGWYRVNGKHTSTLLAMMEKLPEYWVTVEEYECDTLADIARLYSTFDSQTQSRTARDIYVSFAGTVSEIAHIAGRVINCAVPGMAYHLYQGQGGAKPVAERAELLLEYSDFVLWLDRIVGGGAIASRDDPTRKLSEHLRRIGLVAAMMGCWQRDSAKALEFWRAVRDETGEKNTLPDRRLAHFILTTRTQAKGVRTKKVADTREFYCRAIHAWNAWRKGESTKLSYYAEADIPKIV